MTLTFKIVATVLVVLIWLSVVRAWGTAYTERLNGLGITILLASPLGIIWLWGI